MEKRYRLRRFGKPPGNARSPLSTHDFSTLLGALRCEAMLHRLGERSRVTALAQDHCRLVHRADVLPGKPHVEMIEAEI